MKDSWWRGWLVAAGLLAQSGGWAAEAGQTTPVGHGSTGRADGGETLVIDLAREAAETARELARYAGAQGTPEGGSPASKPAETSNAAPHWGYRGTEGPRYWGSLSPEYRLCQIGRNQSPVNLQDEVAVGAVGLPPLEVVYRPVRLNIVNNGHTIQVNYPIDNSYLKIGDHRYELIQFHFHTPSEHQKAGFQYPMEMHLVHRDGAGRLAVIGILYREGAFNPALQKLIDHLPRKPGKPKRYRDVEIDLTAFFPENKLFYKYSGSLTTPPCSEGVYWMVFRQPIEAAPEQIAAMQAVMGHNARPVQPLYSRHVLKSWAETAPADAGFYYTY